MHLVFYYITSALLSKTCIKFNFLHVPQRGIIVLHALKWRIIKENGLQPLPMRPPDKYLMKRSWKVLPLLVFPPQTLVHERPRPRTPQVIWQAAQQLEGSHGSQGKWTKEEREREKTKLEGTMQVEKAFTRVCQRCNGPWVHFCCYMGWTMRWSVSRCRCVCGRWANHSSLALVFWHGITWCNAWFNTSYSTLEVDSALYNSRFLCIYFSL